MTSDLFNGAFEATSAAFVTLNVRQLILDKQIKGLSLIPATFFAAWGGFNLWFYPHLNLWWSFAGGVLLTTVSMLWLGLAIYFQRKIVS